MQGKFLEESVVLPEERRLLQTQTTKRLNFSFQALDLFLILSKGVLEAKAPVKVSYSPDQNSQKNGAENN